ncbi:hypothetical protein ACMGDK_17045 [Chryseobacterium sp. DT-3]
MIQSKDNSPNLSVQAGESISVKSKDEVEFLIISNASAHNVRIEIEK